MAFFHLYLQTSFLYFYFHVKVTDSSIASVPAHLAKPLVPKTIFSFSVSQHANERQSFFTNVCKKSPHCGDLRDFTGCSEPVFNLQVFFASVKALPCRYLLQAPSFSLRPKSGQICFKQSYPATYSTCFAKRHTGANRAQKKANLLARLFFVLLILLFQIRKSYHFLVKYPLLSCVRLQSLPAILLFGRTHRIKLPCVLC